MSEKEPQKTGLEISTVKSIAEFTWLAALLSLPIEYFLRPTVNFNASESALLGYAPALLLGIAFFLIHPEPVLKSLVYLKGIPQRFRRALKIAALGVAAIFFIAGLIEITHALLHGSPLHALMTCIECGAALWAISMAAVYLPKREKSADSLLPHESLVIYIITLLCVRAAPFASMLFLENYQGTTGVYLMYALAAFLLMLQLFPDERWFGENRDRDQTLRRQSLPSRRANSIAIQKTIIKPRRAEPSSPRRKRMSA